MVRSHGTNAVPPFALPVEIRIDHHASWARRARCRAASNDRSSLFGADGVAEAGVVPFQRAGVARAYGSSSSLLGLKAMARVGRVRPVHAVAVDGAGPDIGHDSRARSGPCTPAGGCARRVSFLPVASNRQTSTLVACSGREQREVRSGSIPGRATRKGHAASRRRQLDVARWVLPRFSAFPALEADESAYAPGLPSRHLAGASHPCHERWRSCQTGATRSAMPSRVRRTDLTLDRLG